MTSVCCWVTKAGILGYRKDWAVLHVGLAVSSSKGGGAVSTKALHQNSGTNLVGTQCRDENTAQWLLSVCESSKEMVCRCVDKDGLDACLNVCMMFTDFLFFYELLTVVSLIIMCDWADLLTLCVSTGDKEHIYIYRHKCMYV